MSKRRIYFSGFLSKNQPVTIDGDKYHHLVNILKLGENDLINVFNNQEEWEGSIIKVTKKSLVFLPLAMARRSEIFPHLPLVLYCPLIKKDVFYQICRQAIEQGVGDIIPYTSTHSTAVGHQISHDKLNRIAIEALEQSNGLILPLIHKLHTFKEVMKNKFITLFGDERSMKESIDNNEKVPFINLRFLGEMIGKTFKTDKLGIMIGPEGGFNDYERNIMYQADNFIPINLGYRIMRCETAAISLIQLAKLITNK